MHSSITIKNRVLIACLAAVAALPLHSHARPNIVFVLVDDLGWQDVGFNGSQYYETPNLDQLAAESVVFKNAYMYPTCSPSRAALLTGKQSFRTGVYTVPVIEKGDNQENIFSRWTVEKKHDFYSRPLNDAGYKLIHLGKWHVVGPSPHLETDFPLKEKLKQLNSGNFDWLEQHLTPEIQAYYPIGKGFHENVGGTWWGDPALGTKGGYKNPGGGYVAPFGNPFIEDKEDGEWLTDRLTSDAIEFMEANKDGPFFVNLWYYTVHRPTVARSAALREKYMNKPGDELTGQGLNKGGDVPAYATMIESLDDNIGRILDYLDQSGLRENTVIVFTSDNGHNWPSNTRQLRGGKGQVYEGGIRVPSLVHWEDKIKPQISSESIGVLDWFPTILDLAGILDYQGLLDGDSIIPLLKGGTLGDRALFWHIASSYKSPPSSIIRKGEWKLIQNLLDGSVELYNLETDSLEANNLFKSNPEKAEELLDELTNWRIENQAPIPPASVLLE
jgi:arylsulfatase A-like enzyme